MVIRNGSKNIRSMTRGKGPHVCEVLVTEGVAVSEIPKSNGRSGNMKEK